MDNQKHIRFIVLMDLHLSDAPDTAALAALQWAVEEIKRQQPDFVALAGDMTTYGTKDATARWLEVLAQVQVPVLFTPGNAELRSDAGLPLLRSQLARENRRFQHGNLLVLLPDTSTGRLPIAERQWLEREGVADTDTRRIIITHYPLDVLEQESAAWLERWLVDQKVELLVGGHRHVHRRRHVGAIMEFVCRGLDPDKAIGDLPGISLLESPGPGVWSERFLPWSPAIELLPADLPEGVSPVGWSIHGDPVDAARETREFGLSCLELRPKKMDFSRAALSQELARLRDGGPLYLSYHLPDLKWDGAAGRIVGEERLQAGLEVALEVGVDSLTMHVPRALSRDMGARDMGASAGDVIRSTEQYAAFLECYARLFAGPLRAGTRLAMENIHNLVNTPVDSPQLEFATRIDEYVHWIDAVREEISDVPPAAIGSLFDLGHARNNGGQLDNMQPLCDWYARLGRRILGYHIHQIGIHPDTGKLANHLEITSLFGRRISYAGFLWAWSVHQVSRAPLFVEVRQAAGRRASAARLKQLFEQAGKIKEGVDLPDRGSADSL
jgi:predicted phosphodiesterase